MGRSTGYRAIDSVTEKRECGGVTILFRDNLYSEEQPNLKIYNEVFNLLDLNLHYVKLKLWFWVSIGLQISLFIILMIVFFNVR